MKNKLKRLKGLKVRLNPKRHIILPAMNNKYGEGLYALNGSSPCTVFFKPYQKYKVV
jgi:hypothetical protein